MNPVDKYIAYTSEKLLDTMAFLMMSEDPDQRKALREQAASYAAILSALREHC